MQCHSPEGQNPNFSTNYNLKFTFSSELSRGKAVVVKPVLSVQAPHRRRREQCHT